VTSQLSFLAPATVSTQPLVLRPYQARALAEVRESIHAGKKRILVCAIVGAGKTCMFASICAMAHRKGNKTLTVAHRIELINQTLAMYERAGIPPEQIGVHCGDHPRRNDEAPHQIASVQTLLHRPIPPADLLIIDECKHCSAESYQRVIRAVSNAVLIGFDATPVRYDGKGLGDTFEVLVQISKPSELIAQGYLVEPRVIALRRTPNLSGVHTRAGDYVVEELEAACNTQELRGDLVEAYKAYSAGVRALCFATTVNHSREIVRDFVAAEVPAEHVDANTPLEQRAAIFDRFRAGITLVISNVMIAGEGTDLPVCKTVIMARPTKSLAVFIQTAGRAMRPDPNNPKAHATILDHVGNTARFGLPHEDREWSLDPSEIKGPGEGPVKRCDTFVYDGNAAPGSKTLGCLGLSPTASRYCRGCNHPFYPKCPRCKPRFSKNGDFLGTCNKCDRGITPIDMTNPPATVRCSCCGTLFIPFRDLSLGSKSDLVEKTKEHLQEERHEKDPGPSEKQIALLVCNGISYDPMTRTEATTKIHEIANRSHRGLRTIKQSKILAKHGLQLDLPFE
jgi:DNA repair protein RadD